MVYRVYVEKKPGFDVEAQHLAHELREIVGITELAALRIINRYDVEGVSKELFESCIPTVFSEPQTDNVSKDLPRLDAGERVFAVEYLPGQFDMRASSASECVQLISQGNRPEVASAKVYVLTGALNDEDLATIKRYVINPVEAREASLEVRDTLVLDLAQPAQVEILEGFCVLSQSELAKFRESHGLAMDQADIEFVQDYFKKEQRDPTITEIRVIDTYWSDHCRHTTFGTVLDNVLIDDAQVRAEWERYLMMRQELGREDKPICLMDIATIGARVLAARGILTGLDESDEINACTVRAKVDVDGELQDWLYLFKNETHNHPTEIEPFGGAATCIGGAIRDPLSGRSYVYQAMRVTGAADPTVPVAETLAGKLPQRKLVTTAADGYSSYGNQIGLATGQVSELYHPGYMAKRMEIGAVVGATPADHVRRETPAPGDVIVLLGGRTGRDGIGGATGSSKAHTAGSLTSCGAEVQKGNAPIERKLQRLFRRKDACELIKRCNDFGAGGVAVAIGEIADGLTINLDVVPKKYEGLDGTELAISESQERMAVALAPEDVDRFLKLAREENLEATPVATVTAEQRLCMYWQGVAIVDISREFLASNGAPKHQDAHVEAQKSWQPTWAGETFAEKMSSVVSDLNVACNKGLAERFDSTIGAATVLAPYGGARQLTPSKAMVAKLPVEGETHTVSGMAWGFNPYLMSASPYAGAYISVVESVSKMVATGFAHRDLYLTFQEYFERLRSEPTRWGKPLAALLGALSAQVDLGIGAIGGKDSMSGSFEELDVPPTLVSFATGLGRIDSIVSPELKAAGNRIALVAPRYDGSAPRPHADSLLAVFDLVEDLIAQGKVLSASTCGYAASAGELFEMCLGNRLGIDFDSIKDPDQLFVEAYGSFMLEIAPETDVPSSSDSIYVEEIGTVSSVYTWKIGNEEYQLSAFEERWAARLEGVFPWRNDADATSAGKANALPILSHQADKSPYAVHVGSAAKPRVVIPVFPGNNCEYDSAAAFERAGAASDVFVINNLTPQAVAESTAELARRISKAQMVMIPGGFSGGDEPDGSAKFITAFFRAEQVTEAVRDLLQSRDGLMLGICNGFQALIKLGLVPYGDIVPMTDACPTLTFNQIGRHQSMLVRTRVASTLSPWLANTQVGDIHTLPISNGEGRFVASSALLEQLAASGQIATQYVDAAGVPSMDWRVNPSGAVWAVEGITSPDGRVFGKMGHTERTGADLFQNIPNKQLQPLFEAGVAYFA